MPSAYLQTTPLAEARQKYLDFIEENCVPLGTETIPVSTACGRILSKAVYAHISAPHYYAAAMDGIAMVAKDGFGASETTPVKLGKYEVVDTGDPVPLEYDCVVMVEDVIQIDGAPAIVGAPTPWQHIRQIGEDISQGEMALPSYTRLSPAAIGALASCGVTEVEVLRVPLVGIIPTGDEIVPPSQNPKPGDVMEFNSLIYTGMLEEYGARGKTYPIVPDDPDQITKAVKTAAIECDAVILIAGSSKGRGDFAMAAIESTGSVLLHGVAIRPGKPVILGQVAGKPVLGAPGYPVSGVITIRELLRPAIEKMTHCALPNPIMQKAVLGRKVVSPLQYEEFIRCRLSVLNGSMVAMPLGAGASVVSSFAKSDGILRVPQNVDMLNPGDEVEVELLRDMDVIQNTLSIVGSHDPLFDEVGDLLQRAGTGLYLASSHVGSMGAINALKAGQAHAGGIHLLDAATGAYNISYLKQYFPAGGVKLMRGVGRQQGIMVAKGNPKGIEGIADFVRDGLRYVNRQKGAGTRILLDYLLEKEGLNAADIYGYDREEMTHFSVAAQVASGSADAGLGVYSAAAAYNLDFIPVYLEQYDVLLSDSFAEDPRFAAFREVFQSDELKQRLEALGGYTTENMGEFIDWQNQ